ncbi:conjugative transposon protein TraK [Pedobacter frigoris]|uniref:conjugative transposon protein TraK n=1 Tax=Pedobacter frigoris TaxID=2571272 RepID=UPI0029306A70|nr:conjugative transposon protein TraK [Pedobacter frigoris]
MFTATKNIDTAFRQYRTFCLLFMICNVITICFCIYRCEKRIDKAENKVLILLNGAVVKAMASNRKDNLVVEAKDHIKSFHEHFFSLDPDEKVIISNITEALYLADGTAKRAYDNLKESGYYSGIISSNISQQIHVDSVTLQTEEYPYLFRCYATQKIARSTSTVLRSLVTQGTLRNVSRSDNNPHGFLIQDWATVENRDIDVKK